MRERLALFTNLPEARVQVNLFFNLQREKQEHNLGLVQKSSS